jgi:hypothetical protein
MWTCPKCGAKVEPSYDVCWRCGTTAEGVEDPGFVPADEVGPIEDPPLVAELEAETGPEPDLMSEVPEPGGADLVECYWALDVMQAGYLAEQLTGQGIPAVADTQDIRLRGVGGAVTKVLAVGNPYFGPRVRVRREDLARARAWLEEYERRRKAGG